MCNIHCGGHAEVSKSHINIWLASSLVRRILASHWGAVALPIHTWQAWQLDFLALRGFVIDFIGGVQVGGSDVHSYK
jgi:hypothetical protein